MLAEASRLVERHIALPYVALRGMASRGNDVVTRDDLLQAGMMGLVEAARRYDPAQEAAFSTFAMLRIRGAMLDAIRQSDRTWGRWSGRRRAVVMSLERERTESGRTLGDVLEDPVTGRLEEQGCARAMVAEALARLPRRWQVVLDLYYRQGWTFREIGEELGVGVARACQLHRKAIEALRKAMGVEGLMGEGGEG